MNPQERRVRVVLTDGERTADFAWLRHAAGEVVCGVPDNASWHVTYPPDGRAHYTVREGAGHTRKFLPVPLDSFGGQRTLLALGLASTTLADADLRPFERKAQDVVAFLDLRAFPEVGVVWVELGIVEAWMFTEYELVVDICRLLPARWRRGVVEHLQRKIALAVSAARAAKAAHAARHDEVEAWLRRQLEGLGKEGA